MSHKIFFILVLALLLAGCAGTPQSATEVTVEATDFAYKPASISVPSGPPVTLTLKIIGAVEHDFVVDKITVSDVEASESGPAEHHQMEQPEYDLHFFAKAGESAVLRFTPVQPAHMKSFARSQGIRKPE